MDAVLSVQGDTLDALCFRYYGQNYGAGVVEQAYQANYGLCELGAVLPIGTRVVMPTLEKNNITETVQLWN